MEQFYQYKDMVYRLALSYLKNPSIAEDVVQDVFLQYLSKKPLHESNEHEKAWFIRVTLNRCKNILHLAWFRCNVALEDYLTIDFETPEESDLFYAVMQLSHKYRIVIHLHYYEGYPVSEIATMLKVSANTVSARLFRARAKLKEALSPLKGDEASESKIISTSL